VKSATFIHTHTHTDAGVYIGCTLKNSGTRRNMAQLQSGRLNCLHVDAADVIE
jgi:hypothetical protein